MIFGIKTFTDNIVRAAKDHGNKFRSRLAASFALLTIVAH